MWASCRHLLSQSLMGALAKVFIDYPVLAGERVGTMLRNSLSFPNPKLQNKT